MIYRFLDAKRLIYQSFKRASYFLNIGLWGTNGHNGTDPEQNQSRSILYAIRSEQGSQFLPIFWNWNWFFKRGIGSESIPMLGIRIGTDFTWHDLHTVFLRRISCNRSNWPQTTIQNLKSFFKNTFLEWFTPENSSAKGSIFEARS